ncbi:MAG: PDZ domain-containing protein [Planctomycetes bacterium]|nr:PDZ domain-containing protein [Planctomycetota bacterium]
MYAGTMRRWTLLASILAIGMLIGTAQAAEKQHHRRKRAKDRTPAVHVEKKYWLGIACAPVPEEVRAQLDLPENVGLIVQDVVKDTPADKAGLRKYDIIVKADQTDITAPEVLVEAVQKAKDREMELQILRKGKRRTIRVQPVQRTDVLVEELGEGEPEEFFVEPPSWDDEQFGRFWQEFRRGPRRFHFRFFGQPWVFGWEPEARLPENLKITIHKEGHKPARIEVERDGQHWDVTEEELDKLPPDVRRHVQRMLGRGVGARVFRWDDKDWELDLDAAPGPGGSYRMLLRRLKKLEDEKAESTERVEKKLEETLRHVEELQKRLEELQKQLKQKKASEGNRPKA